MAAPGRFLTQNRRISGGLECLLAARADDRFVALGIRFRKRLL